MSIPIAGLAVGPGVGVRAAVAGRGVTAVAVAAKKIQSPLRSFILSKGKSADRIISDLHKLSQLIRFSKPLKNTLKKQ